MFTLDILLYLFYINEEHAFLDLARHFPFRYAMYSFIYETDMKANILQSFNGTISAPILYGRQCSSVLLMIMTMMTTAHKNRNDIFIFYSLTAVAPSACRDYFAGGRAKILRIKNLIYS